MIINRFQAPSESMGVPQRGIVPPLEAHREQSELCNFRRNCVCRKEVFSIC